MLKQGKSNRRAASPSIAKPPNEVPVGVVGMGLMGTSICACLLAAGHRLHCVESDPARIRTARRRLLAVLKEAASHGLIKESLSSVLERFTVSSTFDGLKDAKIVVESTVESLSIKRRVIKEIEKVVSSRTLIGSNTSSIPITELQKNARHPERVLGLHWAEPATATRFMEIVCGSQTSLANARRAERLARGWGKEPSLIRRDIRGFITNRIMYSMLREAFHLVDSGYATVADVDRSMRNDLGYWITFAGPFRFMDLMGIRAYKAVMKGLLPDLNCAKRIPRLMQKVTDSGGRGTSNAKGFYRYTPAQAKRWEKLFRQFSFRIRDLAKDYPEDVGDRPSLKRKRTT
jgi:3-hydroxybutyryl-CoA dehydrogenase